MEINAREGPLPDGMTALHLAASRDLTDAVKLLFEHGANPNLRGRQGTVALHLAYASQNMQTVQVLLSQGAKILPDRNGIPTTPMDIPPAGFFNAFIMKYVLYPQRIMECSARAGGLTQGKCA